jgi:3-hydroxybutyryl-CoA dehydrogenase
MIKRNEIKKIAVVGLGIMGPGIMQTFAQAGFDVAGFDVSRDAEEKCRKVLTSIFETLEKADMITSSEIVEATERISFFRSLENAVENADIVIEAVSENADIKRSVYEKLDSTISPECYIWSNTSTMDIFKLLPERRQEKALIVHWFAPPHIIPLVEIVKGSVTASEAVEFATSLLKKLNKIPIVIEKFVPGFVINRILRSLGREAFFLLDNNYISAQNLDLAVKASIAPRMMLLGLIQRYDFTGLDLSARNLLDENIFDPPIDNEPVSLCSKITNGDLGVKSGKGFYDYSDRPIHEIYKERDLYLLEIMKNLQFCLTEDRLV